MACILRFIRVSFKIIKKMKGGGQKMKRHFNRFLKNSGKAAVAFLALMALGYSGAEATNLEPFTTIYNTDYTSAGFGGMRGIGTGTLSLTGVSGPVTKAFLYWHGPGYSTSPTANATVDFNGNTITGTSLGLSSDNCWGYPNSQAYRADVTGLVTGNGNYSLSNFYKPGVADINGVSLMAFYNDGNPSNNRDIVIFNGNDSNIDNPYDAPGWNITLSGINYTSGQASAEFHVSDGQTFPDAAVIANGQTIAPAGSVFDGNTVPGGPGGPSNGYLWDIRSFDITGLLTPGPNTLNITSGVNSDCLSCVAININLPAGAAPPPVGVPEPSTILLVGTGLSGIFFMRKKMKG